MVSQPVLDSPRLLQRPFRALSAFGSILSAAALARADSEQVYVVLQQLFDPMIPGFVQAPSLKCLPAARKRATSHVAPLGESRSKVLGLKEGVPGYGCKEPILAYILYPNIRTMRQLQIAF